jgi:hypothetical protein
LIKTAGNRSTNSENICGSISISVIFHHHHRRRRPHYHEYNQGFETTTQTGITLTVLVLMPGCWLEVSKHSEGAPATGQHDEGSP